MDAERIRQILEDVAAGRTSPTDAGRLLDEEDDQPQRNGTTGGASSPDVPAVKRLQVRATSRRVRLMADPSVTTVDVEGPHTLRREGDTLVLTSEGERFVADDAFSLLSSGRWRDVTDRLSFGSDLRVRVRPDLPVDAEVIAGSLTTEGLQGLHRARVTAGSAKVRGSNGPLELLVQAGSGNLEAALSKGRNRVRCESGSIHVRLLPGSDVRVRADTQLSRFAVEPPQQDSDFVVGSGAAELDIELVMGHGVVKVDQ